MPGRAEKIFCHKNYKGCKRQSCRLQPFLIIYKIRILRLQIYLIRILQLQSLTWISWIISSITRSPVIVIILWLFSTRLHDAAGMLHLDYQNRWYQILLLLHEFFHHFFHNSLSFNYLIQVSQVTSGPRRGPTFNNRWWNDRRSWNLRTTNSREKASPKGANHIQSCSCSPPSGTIREYL